jgi:hypothetical protein
MYTACICHISTGLVRTLSLTSKYKERRGHLPANFSVTVYYLQRIGIKIEANANLYVVGIATY